MKHLRFLALSAVGTFAMAMASVAQNSPTQAPGFSVLEAEQVAGHQLFKDHCGSCHTSPVSYGPSLNGIVGRRAGSLPLFPYSDALKKSGLVWTEDNLRKWIANSAEMIPNTLMPHVSIRDPAEQIYLVAYVKTLKAPAGR